MTFTLRAPMALAAGLALLVALAPGAAIAQTTSTDQTPPKMGMGMMADHQKMAAQMQASGKKLDDLVAAMNLAQGGDKLDRITAVLTELVAQHRQMREHMSTMGGMTQMPMRQGAPAAAPTPPARGDSDDHAGHHPQP